MYLFFLPHIEDGWSSFASNHALKMEYTPAAKIRNSTTAMAEKRPCHHTVKNKAYGQSHARSHQKAPAKILLFPPIGSPAS